MADSLARRVYIKYKQKLSNSFLLQTVVSLRSSIFQGTLPSSISSFLNRKYFQRSKQNIKEPLRFCQGGGEGGLAACLNFKRSPAGALSMFHFAVAVAVGNSKKGCRMSQFHFKCYLSLLFRPCRLSEFTLSEPHLFG